MTDEHSTEEHLEVHSSDRGTTEHREVSENGEKVVDETSHFPTAKRADTGVPSSTGPLAHSADGCRTTLMQPSCLFLKRSYISGARSRSAW